MTSKKPPRSGSELTGRVVKVYPELAAAILNSGYAPVGRLWLLLLAHDTPGRGLMEIGHLYHVFAEDTSPWYLCSRRRVQQLIKQGAGTFWTLRNQQRGRFTALQRTGPGKLALALGVTYRLTNPVPLQVADLLNGMHSANAALFSAELATHIKGNEPRPISRAALKANTGVAPSTQRTYTKTATIQVIPNFAVLSSGDIEQPGVFISSPQPGKAILLRRLPNAYHPHLPIQAPGRVRKINRELNLVIKKARGERFKAFRARIYHDTESAAWSAWDRNYNEAHYWPERQTSKGTRLWRVIEVYQT